MDDLSRQRLEALAGPGRPFRSGMADNSNAVELEIGQMLLGAVLARQPEVVVELGTGPGYSSCWLLLGLNENQRGELWTVDVIAADNPLWNKLGIPAQRVHYLSNETTESALHLLPKQIQFLFHDCAHQWAAVEKDLALYTPRIAQGGVWVIHDVNYSRMMGDRVAQWFDERPDEWKYEEMSAGCGIGIATRIRVLEPIKKTTKTGGRRARKSKVVQ